MSTDSKLVVLESPYAADTRKWHKIYTKYARKCMRDSLDRGEYPFASHLLYTQDGILDDKIPEERTRGIEAGYAWMEHARTVVFYMDYGLSPGMVSALAKAVSLGKKIEYRKLERL